MDIVVNPNLTGSQPIATKAHGKIFNVYHSYLGSLFDI
jgi:hypothetical protein